MMYTSTIFLPRSIPRVDDVSQWVKFQQRYQMRHRNSRSEDLCRAVAMARRLPGSTSTCSASMTSRTRSCETASEFDPQNWWTKWGHFWGSPKSENPIYRRG